MRHFRRSRRHRSHGYGSYRHHGYYGRDEMYGHDKRSVKFGTRAWFERKHGHHFKGYKDPSRRAKAVTVAYKKWLREAEGIRGHLPGGKKSRPAKRRGSRKQGQANFKQRLQSLRGLLGTIAPTRKKSASANASHRKRKLTAARKLKMIAAEMNRLKIAYAKAEKRAKTAAERAAAKKAKERVHKAEQKVKKAQKAASKPGHPAKAEQDLHDAHVKLYEQKKYAESFNIRPSQSHKTTSASSYGGPSFWPSSIFGHDKKPKKGSKKSAKKGSKKKSAKKGKYHPKKKSAKKGGKKSKAMQKRMAGLKRMHRWKAAERKKKKYKKMTPKRRAAAVNRAWKAHRRKTGRDPFASTLFFA